MTSVLFLIPTLGGGGAERVLVNLANYFDASKYDVTVQTLFKAGVNVSGLKPHVHLIEGARKLFAGYTQLMLLFSPKFLYEHLVKKRYDVVVSYLEGPTARIVSGCPYIDSKLIAWIHIEHLNLKCISHSFRSVCETKQCYGKFDKIVGVANTVCEDFAGLLGMREKLCTLYNTNDDTLIRELAREAVTDMTFPEVLKIISVGRLSKQKGFDRLVEVHARLVAEGFKHHLYIMGQGEEKEALISLIKENGVEDTAHIIPFNKNPYKYMVHADLYVCSSLYEGFSTTVTEALILGIPVVSTCCSGAEELLGKNNEYGIVTENSTNGIYHGVKKMLEDKQTLQHYTQQARERGKRFSKENCVNAVESLIDSLVQTKA